MTSISSTTVMQAVEKGLSQKADQLTELLKTADMTDPTAMLRLQEVEGQYEVMLKMTSAMVADVKNAVSSIAQKS